MSKIESISTAPLHFEEHHENNENIFCVQQGVTCSLLVEIVGTPEQQAVLAGQSKKAMDLLDAKLNGKFTELFEGTHVVFTDHSGGGYADREKGQILLDKDKMSMSLVAAEEYLVSTGVLDTGDWVNTLDPEIAKQPGSCAFYNLIHEFAHLMDEADENGKDTGIPTELSPTKYGAQTDKNNEAFAEAFTHYILGATLSDEAERAVIAKIESFKSRKLKTPAH